MARTSDFQPSNLGAKLLYHFIAEIGTQSEAAERLNLDRHQINRWVRGTSRPDAVAQAFLYVHCGIEPHVWYLPAETDLASVTKLHR